LELQILFVDESAAEVARMVERLRAGGVSLAWRRADSEDGLHEALAAGPWHIALVHADLPSPGCRRACALLARLSPDTAVLTVRGAAGHAALGAVDHVEAADMARLPFAVGRAAGVAQHRRQEAELHETLFDMSALYSQAPFAYHSLDADGLVIRMNETGLSWLGYARNELVDRMHITDVMAAESRALFERSFAGFKERGYLRGLEFTFVRKDGTTFPGLVNATAISDAQGGYVRSLSTVVDISEQVAAREEVRRTADRLRRTVEGTILAMSNVVEARDPYTAGHERRVSELAVAIGREMAMADDDLEGLRLGALIHDIGKIAVPAEILAKPGPLSDVEFTLVEQHSPRGFDILQSIDFAWPIADMVLQHHERLDGSGYPRGLSGDQILPQARILAVADVVEAMSSHRPYRPALGMEAALAEVNAHAGEKYDSAVTDACSAIVKSGAFTFST
jgi:PAS domain S-box-containing protein